MVKIQIDVALDNLGKFVEVGCADEAKLVFGHVKAE